MHFPALVQEAEFEDTKVVIKILKSKKDRWSKEKGQMDKQRSTKHYT